MRPDDLRKDRRVTNAQPTHAMNAQVCVYHARTMPVRLLSHTARGCIVEAGPDVRANESVEVLVTLPRRNDEVLQRVLLPLHIGSQAEGESQAFAKWDVVLGIRQEPEVDVGPSTGIACRKTNRPVGLRADGCNREREEALPWDVVINRVICEMHQLDIWPVLGAGCVEAV